MNKVFTHLFVVAILFSTISLNGQNPEPVLKFNGSNSYVDLTNYDGSGVRTIEFWFKPAEDITPSLSDFKGLIIRETSGVNHNEMDICFQPNFQTHPGHLSFGITENLSTLHTVFSDNDHWYANEWHHVAAVIDPTEGMMLFIDGIKQQSTNSYTNTPAPDSHDIEVGRWGVENSRYFHGSIDDIRFSSIARYTSNFTPPCPSLPSDSSTIGLWNLNENSGDTASDGSGNDYTGIIHNAVWDTANVCHGNALHFNGIDDYVKLPSQVGSDGVRTIELWFRPSVDITPNLDNFKGLVVRETNGTTNQDEFAINFIPSFMPHAGSLSFGLSLWIDQNFQVFSDSTHWNAGQWYHVAGVIDPVNGMELFINGIKQQDVDSTFTDVPASNSDPITIGGWWPVPNRNFNGDIDAVRISSQALYSDNFTPPCPDLSTSSSTIGMWNFNEQSGDIAYDDSPNSYDGTLYGPQRITATICRKGDNPSGIQPVSSSDFSVNTYPNPSSGEFRFEFSNSNKKQLSVRIYNVVGQLIYQKSVTGEALDVNLKSQSNGVYFYQVFGNKAVLASGKIIKNN